MAEQLLQASVDEAQRQFDSLAYRNRSPRLNGEGDGGLVDLTAAIVVPDDQRQMSRSGAAERYWRTREGLNCASGIVAARDGGSYRLVVGVGSPSALV